MKKATIDNTSDLLMGIIPRMFQSLGQVLKTAESQFPMAQYRVLRLLTNHPMGLSALSKIMEVTKASLCETVNSMVEKSWIEKRKDPSDGRKAILTVTDTGVEQIAEFDSRIKKYIKDHLANVPPEEIQRVYDGIAVMSQYFYGMEIY
jgi:DNA-binding MarR family transcriptional regulator